MAQLYAWSDIKAGTLEKPINIAKGSKVAKSDFPGILDGDWNAMVEGGSIRDRPFPAPDDYQGSAIDYLRDMLAEAQAVSPVDEEEAVIELVAVESAPEAPPAPKAEEKATSKK